MRQKLQRVIRGLSRIAVEVGEKCATSKGKRSEGGISAGSATTRGRVCEVSAGVEPIDIPWGLLPMSRNELLLMSEEWTLNEMVGATGFEPATSRSRTERSTRLSHAPTNDQYTGGTPDPRLQLPNAFFAVFAIFAAFAVPNWTLGVGRWELKGYKSPMPIYEYECRGCHHQFEQIVRTGDVPACPKCQSGDLERLLSHVLHELPKTRGSSISTRRGRLRRGSRKTRTSRSGNTRRNTARKGTKPALRRSAARRARSCPAGAA